MKFDTENFGASTFTSEKNMPEFRKKPVVVSASQWFKNGDHPLDHHPFVHGGDSNRYSDYVNDVEGKVVRRYREPGVEGKSVCRHCGEIMHIHGWVDTLEGGHIVCPGDWIITGVKGENYPCKQDIFSATYDAVPHSEEACRQCDAMTFGLAIEALKKGLRVARSGWNEKGMFVFIIQGSNDIAKLHGYGFGECSGEPTFRDSVFMKTVDNQLVPWTVSQTDMLAEDWVIVE